jgi:DNA polymerase-3 subunit gamma/tau
MARILAKALNCEKGPTAAPCGTCSICQSIATGEDVDVLEIDGASNNKVDEVREIRSNVQYRPSRARFKIYIIDEVHMLTVSAFNALLKTLEEPPPHVKFIFATTEVQKLPITILSRCQRFDFPGIAVPLIVERLREVVTQEGMQADDDALELVARRAGGSMRDAQSLLDQLLAFGGERLTADQAHHLLGTASDQRILGLAEAVLAPDPKMALSLLEEAIVGGIGFGELVDQLIAYWRDLLVVHCAGSEGPDLSVPSRHRDTLTRQAKGLHLDTILAGLDVLSTTRNRLRGSSHGRTLVEMALVRLGRLRDLVALTQLARSLEQPAPSGAARAAPSAAPAVKALPPESVKKKSLSSAAETEPVLNQETLPDLWAQTLGLVGAILAGHLDKAGIPAILGPNTLALRFPAVYNREREYCQEPTRLARAEEALKKLTGRPWTLRVESRDSEPVVEVSPEAASEEVPARPRSNPREEAEKLPLIKRAMEVLGATIQRVEEGFGAAPPAAPQRGDRPAQEP